MCFSTEFVRFCGTFFFEWDIELTVDGQPATCNTSDLNEELGQVCFFPFLAYYGVLVWICHVFFPSLVKPDRVSNVIFCLICMSHNFKLIIC